MEIPHPAARLQNPHPVTGTAIAISALDAQHPTPSRFASSIGSPVGIRKLAGGRARRSATGGCPFLIAIPVRPVGLGFSAASDEQAGQHEQRQSPQSSRSVGHGRQFPESIFMIGLNIRRIRMNLD